MSEMPSISTVAKGTAIRIIAACALIAVVFGYFVFRPMQSELRIQTETQVALTQECSQKQRAVKDLRQRLEASESVDLSGSRRQLAVLKPSRAPTAGPAESAMLIHQPGSVLRVLSKHHVEVASLERSDASEAVEVQFSSSYQQAQNVFQELAASSGFVQVSVLACQADQYGGGDWQLTLEPAESVQ